jgi:ABC-type uncharacterized transport system substrate-binding protein
LTIASTPTIVNLVTEKSEDEGEVVDTSDMSQLEYVDALIHALVPAVEDTMRCYPPPDNHASTGAAGFIQAFTHLGLTITTTLGLHPIEFARALQTLAADIEMDAINKLAAVLDKEPKPAKKAPSEEAPVDF